MFGIGETELLIIVLFGFMIFGPDKLPGAGRTIGRALRQFRTAQQGFTKVVQTEIVDPATEMMNLDANKPNRDRAAELEEDADIEAGEDGAEAPRKETFAERKARLAAERAAAKKAEEEAAAQAEAEAAAAAVAAAEAEAPAEAEGDAQPAAEEKPAEAPAPKPAAPKTAMPKKTKPTAAADLYAKPVKKARKQAEPVEEAPAPEAPEAADAGKEDEDIAE
ncbi:MAG: twin-arginine translocase TatA/TatE family subunit [Atopobiaceae bacterium]|nr:twin-arginine translocase TatA/TatE family subunit [Atopobiaceae bacterium]